jgi:hypothetical protein
MPNNVVPIPYLDTGAKLYGILRDDDGKPWNGSAFETYATANLGTYDLPFTEQGTASKIHTLAFPTAITDAGWYTLAVYVYAVEGSPAESDLGPVWMTDLYWTGVAITPGPVIPPADPAKSAVSFICYGEDTLPQAGVVIYYQQKTIPSSDQNHTFDGDVESAVSDSNGLITLTLWRNAQYAWKRGDGAWSTFTPTGATHNLVSIVGRDS